MLTPEILGQAEALLELCRKNALKLATVESCTGGLVSAALTAIPGSSDVFDRGFATYSNEAKNELVGVPMQLIIDHGAVSEEVAIAMAQGGLNHSNADIAVSITGVAGPGGGTETKPVGLVHFACARPDIGVSPFHTIFPGDRNAIREQSVRQALTMMNQAASSDP